MEFTVVFNFPLLVDALVRPCRVGSAERVPTSPEEAAKMEEVLGAGGCSPTVGGGGAVPSGAVRTSGGERDCSSS